MNDQEMRLRALELAVEWKKLDTQRRQLGLDCGPAKTLFVIAEEMFNYVWSGDHPDQNRKEDD